MSSHAPSVESDRGTESARAVAERVAEIAHDFRNPLGSISLNAELVAAMAGDDADEGIGEGLAALERAVTELEARLAELDAYLDGVRGRP